MFIPFKDGQIILIIITNKKIRRQQKAFMNVSAWQMTGGRWVVNSDGPELETSFSLNIVFLQSSLLRLSSNSIFCFTLSKRDALQNLSVTGTRIECKRDGKREESNIIKKKRKEKKRKGSRILHA